MIFFHLSFLVLIAEMSARAKRRSAAEVPDPSPTTSAMHSTPSFRSARRSRRKRADAPSEYGPVLDAACTEIFEACAASATSEASAARISDATKTLITSATSSVVVAVAADQRLTAGTIGPISAMLSGLLANNGDETLAFVAYAIAGSDESGTAVTNIASVVAKCGAATAARVAALAALTDTRGARRLLSEMFGAPGLNKETTIRIATAQPETLAPHALDTFFSDGPSAQLVASVTVSGYLDPASKWTRRAVERVLANDRVVETKAFWHPDVLALVQNVAELPAIQHRAATMMRLIAVRDARLTARSGLLKWAAAEESRVRYLRLLFDAGVLLSFRRSSNYHDYYVEESVRAAVSVACQAGNVAALRMLVRADADCVLRHFNDAGLAYTLLRTSPYEFVAFAEDTRIDLMWTFVDGHHSLAMVAASTGNAAALVYLLERGCDTTLVTHDTRESLMHLIAKLDGPSIDMVTACVERMGSTSVIWGMLRDLYKKDSSGSVPIEVCSRAQPACIADGCPDPRDGTLSRFMRLCAAIDRAPNRRVLLLFGFLAARDADAAHIIGVARSLGYSAEDVCGARTKDNATDTIGLAASRADDALFRELVSHLVSEGAASAALFRCDALFRLALRSHVAFVAIYNDVVVPEARAHIQKIDRASSLAISSFESVSVDLCVFGREVAEDARLIVDRINARRRLHESYLDLSAARDLFPACARVVARSVESTIYSGSTSAHIDGIEVFEFMLGIGAHEPHGFSDDTCNYFASVFAPCARHILESLRGTGRVMRYARELCNSVHSKGQMSSRNLEHVRIERNRQTIQPEVLDAIFDDHESDDGTLPQFVDYNSISDIRFAGEDASGQGQTREAIGVLWSQTTGDQDAFALTPGGLVPRPFACERLMWLAGFLMGIAMRANIPLGLPHLCPIIATAVVAASGPAAEHDIGELAVSEMFGADGIVLAAKSPSFTLGTEECVSYCSPFRLSSDRSQLEGALCNIGPVVTHSTFKTLCTLVADAVLGTPALHTMRRGFHSALCGTYTWGARRIASMLASSIFVPRDASLLFFGTSDVSVERIKAKTQLVSGTSDDAYASHETGSLALFWQIFTELTEEQRLRLFTFWTSNAAFPVVESPDEVYLISPLPIHNAPLFTAATCANHLRVPRYTDKKTMLAKMLTSLDACGYMGLV
jgi:hypothetical protein